MASHLDALRCQARTLPEASGVYFWKDHRGKILYIGKAVNLRNRVSSYFSTARRDRRVRELLSRAVTIEYELTGTELEALFRESALIKREQPRFNRALKQSRALWYLKFDASLADPYMEVTRTIDEDGSLYFGPFRTAAVLRETMEFLHAVLPLRKCHAAKPRCAPCMYHQMGTCAAPLLSDVHRRRHQEAIARLFDLLDGRSDHVMAWLEGKRDRLADSLLFERAAEVQERIQALRELIRKQVILDAAVQCRCVLIRHEPARADEERLLLVAHGHVTAIRQAASLGEDEVVAWVRAYGPVLKASRNMESEIDAASVLERWLTVNRERVRWVAIPLDADQADLTERVRYVLTSDVDRLAPSLAVP